MNMTLKKYAMLLAGAVVVAIVAKPVLEYVSRMMLAIAGLLPGV